jgi:polyisoprenoid-binding protein YceI
MPVIRSRIHRPRTLRAWSITTLAGAVIVVAAFGGVYLTLFRGSSVAPLSLSTTTQAPAPALTATQLSGSWTVASGSVAGYRVREQLAFLASPSDAVGRTSAVTGTMTLAGTPPDLTVSAAALTVDVTKLTSDDGRRDQRIRTSGLESDRFRTASFTLSSPIALPTTAASGSPLTLSATGALTIHGVTKTVTIPITARLTGSQIELVGSITFPFEQFGMTPPSQFNFVTVQDNATMEFDVRTQHS